ncbi:MAG: ABC transporter ATP-binding protein [Acidimicrobiales bacterium]
MPGDEVITVRHLRKSYGDVVAVDDIDLEVRRGEVLALLGPNGAGKTTTVEILEGCRTRDGGVVSVLGQDPARADSSWRARVGVVLQANNDLSELSVVEVLRHFGLFYPRHREPDELLGLVGLHDKRNARVRQLSGGQRRRLDVALGIIGCPELIFLDEPTTGFDPEVRRQFWQLISDLAAGGTTLVLTTHYLEEAEVLADRLVVIDRGRVLDVGPPASIGGRDRAQVVVSWSDRDGTHTARTDTPTQFVTELGRAAGGEVAGLTVTRPSLEDVYLEMIGART